MTASAQTAPTMHGYTLLAQTLFDRMKKHPPLKELFLEYGITGACFCMASQFGTSLYEFQVGIAGHGTNLLMDQGIANEASRRTADNCSFDSRETRNPTLQKFAGAIRGREHIISCRMIAVQPHSTQQEVAIEDLSEIFAIILGLEIAKKMGTKELIKDHALGFLSRHFSSLLPLFDPFL